MAATLGTKRSGFAAPDPALRARLQALIEQKRDLLTRLDPSAEEALFSPNLSHWLGHPLLALAYLRLVHEEEAVIGVRESVSRAQAWWRAAHLALASLDGVDVSDADLTGADLNGASLVGANVGGADLTGVILTSAALLNLVGVPLAVPAQKS